MSYRGVAELVGKNSDYLVHKISEHLRLRHATKLRPSMAVKVLQSVASHGDEEVCLLIKDVLDELLLSLDLQQLEAGLVWEGLSTVSQSCARWVELRTAGSGKDGGGRDVMSDEVPSDGSIVEDDSEEEKVEIEASSDKGVSLEAIGHFFMKYHKDKAAREERDLGGMAEEGEGSEGGAYSKEKELPCSESICVEVLRRCVHHMSHPVAMVRMKVLASMQHSIKALQSHKVRVQIKAWVWLKLGRS